MKIITIIKLVYDLIKDLKKSKTKEKTHSLTLDTPLEVKVVQEKTQEEKEDKNFNELQTKLKSIFNSHNIDDNLISEFISLYVDSTIKVPVSKKEDLVYIFDKLSDDNIGCIIKKFGINKGWLYNRESLYPYRNYYKNIEKLISFIIDNYNKGQKLVGYIIKKGELDKNNEEYQPLFLIFRVPIDCLFGEYSNTIYRYYPVNTIWRWEYWRSRYQLKSIIYLSEKYNYYFDLYGIHIKNKKDFEKIISLNECPHKLIENNKTPYGWYPYDYITDESFVNSKESDERSNIMNYIKTERYIENFEKRVRKLTTKSQ